MEITMLKRIWLWLTHYAVIVKWDEVEKLHWARDEREAREWMQTYSADALVMIGKRGKLIAARWQA